MKYWEFLKDMPIVTVEQITLFREAALKIAKELDESNSIKSDLPKSNPRVKKENN